MSLKWTLNRLIKYGKHFRYMKNKETKNRTIENEAAANLSIADAQCCSRIACRDLLRYKYRRIADRDAKHRSTRPIPLCHSHKATEPIDYTIYIRESSSGHTGSPSDRSQHMVEQLISIWQCDDKSILDRSEDEKAAPRDGSAYGYSTSVRGHFCTVSMAFASYRQWNISMKCPFTLV